jgi:hypothetical protein
VITRPQTPQLLCARALLASLTSRPGLQALPAIEALATLNDVSPPYSPVQEPDPGTPVDVSRALTALTAAAAVAADPQEAARIAAAARSLTTAVAL